MKLHVPMVIGGADVPCFSEPTIATYAATPFGSPQAVWCMSVIHDCGAAGSGDWPDCTTVRSDFSCAAGGPPGVIRAVHGSRAVVHETRSAFAVQVIL